MRRHLSAHPVFYSNAFLVRSGLEISEHLPRLNVRHEIQVFFMHNFCFAAMETRRYFLAVVSNLLLNGSWRKGTKTSLCSSQPGERNSRDLMLSSQVSDPFGCISLNYYPVECALLRNIGLFIDFLMYFHTNCLFQIKKYCVNWKKKRSWCSPPLGEFKGGEWCATMIAS